MQNEVLFHSSEEYKRFVSENPNDLKDKVFRFDLLVDHNTRYMFEPRTAGLTFSNCHWVFNLTGSAFNTSDVNIFVGNTTFEGDFALTVNIKKYDADFCKTKRVDAFFRFRNCAFYRDIKIESHRGELFDFQGHRFGRNDREITINHVGGSKIFIPVGEMRGISQMNHIGRGYVYLNGARTFATYGLEELEYLNSHLQEYKKFYPHLGMVTVVERFERMYRYVRENGIRDHDSDEIEEKIEDLLKYGLPDYEAAEMHEALRNFVPTRSVELPARNNNDGRSDRPNNDGRSDKPNGL